MDNNISKEILVDFKLLIEYSVDGKTGSLYYDHPYIGELYVSDRKIGTKGQLISKRQKFFQKTNEFFSPNFCPSL